MAALFPALVAFLGIIRLTAAVQINQSPQPIDPGDATHKLAASEGGSVFQTPLALSEPCTSEEYAIKDLDIFVYGATGYIGRQAVNYLSKGHPSRPRWGVGARNPSKLNAVIEYSHNRFAGKPDSNVSSPSVVMKSKLTDADSMLIMAKRSKVIVSFAGPYESYGGEELIRAAVEGCAHYVDVTEELYWMSKMRTKYMEVAKKRGVAIVQSAGFNSMAADVLALEAVSDVDKAGSEPTEVVVVWSKMNAKPSGGEFASEKIAVQQNYFAVPYGLVPESPEENKADVTADGFVNIQQELHQGEGVRHGWDERLAQNLHWYPGAARDCSVIRETMQMKFPKRRIHVREAANQFLSKEKEKYLLDSRNAMLPNTPTDPSPAGITFGADLGTGPKQWERLAGSSKADAYAFANGKMYPQAVVSLDAQGDPLAEATPKIAVELALKMAYEIVPQHRFGYFTPATVFDNPTNLLSNIDKGDLLKFEHTSFLK